jgi:hypothetical protein
MASQKKKGMLIKYQEWEDTGQLFPQNQWIVYWSTRVWTLDRAELDSKADPFTLLPVQPHQVSELGILSTLKLLVVSQ